MNKLWDVTDFGARGDGEAMNTRPIQQAIDACHAAGGGRVLIGPGIFVTGAVELRSQVELHLSRGCRLVGSPRLEDYLPLEAEGFHPDFAPEKSSHSLIRAIGAENAALTGPGTVDGSGLAFYNDPGGSVKLGKPDTPRPRIGMFYRCRGLRIEDTTFTDSACWTLWLMQCTDVNIHRITVRGNRRLRNVDGIDVDGCRDVLISDCRIDTEDDCLVLRSLRKCYDAPEICENVAVSNCVLRSSCQSVRVGCPGDGIIRRCTLSNLTIGGVNGIVFNNPRRYLPAGLPGSAEVRDILFSNLVMHCSGYPIKMDVDAGIRLPYLGDISFSHIHIRSGRPIVIQGSPETIIQNVWFSDLRLETDAEDALLCRYCRGVSLSRAELTCRGKAAGGTSSSVS